MSTLEEAAPSSRDGQIEAFRAIVQTCNQRLFRAARSVVRDDDEAEDVVQASYLRAFAKLGSFRGESSLLTWLTRITLNEALGRLRAQQRLGDNHASGAHDIATPLDENPESEAARAQARRMLEAAIDALPAHYRSVLVLREIEECSVEETAALLELHPNTVKTRTRRALALLRKTLEQAQGVTLHDAFPFLGARCRRITEAVLARMLSASFAGAQRRASPMI
jgi:RNA polymerase sigma-70 factor (ECF subfamily)